MSFMALLPLYTVWHRPMACAAPAAAGARRIEPLGRAPVGRVDLAAVGHRAHRLAAVACVANEFAVLGRLLGLDVGRLHRLVNLVLGRPVEYRRYRLEAQDPCGP